MEEIRLPVVAVTGTLLFPGVTGPLLLSRPRSLASVSAALETTEKLVLIVPQQNPSGEPDFEDLFKLGVQARVGAVAVKKQSEGDRRPPSSEVMVRALSRARLLDLTVTGPCPTARVEILPAWTDKGLEQEAMEMAIQDLMANGCRLADLPLPDLSLIVGAEPLTRLYFMASPFHLTSEQEQSLLEAESSLEAFTRLHEMLTHELQVLVIRKRIVTETQEGLHQAEKDQFLRHQLETIHRQLGDDAAEQSDLDKLAERLDALELPGVAREEASRQLKLLRRMAPAASEYQSSRSYLELVTDLPWNEATEDHLDLARARRVLDADHYGLQPVKERILEHLAVMALNPLAHAPILCFVGPPGTGKTSLGQSIARVLGRKFERIAMGGMHDEAEIRGHRRTYVGAMVGRVVQAVRRARANNPLVMLDEVDKLCSSFQGDPAAALLEVLDPAQNSTFHDNYLDLPFDLSRVFFITTANSLDPIPDALLDRMEIVHLPGYSYPEKLQIAERHLIPRVAAECGMNVEGSGLTIELSPESLQHLLSHHTREAGVRQLERVLARLYRRVALRKAEGSGRPLSGDPLSVQEVEELLGPEEFLQETVRTELAPGVAPGLAWTTAGGVILYIEVALLSEGHDLIMTGHLGDVMKESARTAYSYVLSQAHSFGLPVRKAEAGSALHIHVPSGGTPKDGPSAGLAIVVALVSALIGKSARADTAMTGEVTLSGLVLPVGGIHEKVLAAHQAGLKRVLIPHQNVKDLVNIPASLKDEMDIHLVDRIEDALPLVIANFPHHARRR